MVLESSLGGVPVLSLPILKLCLVNCSDKPMDALSLNLPADVLSSPICMRPFKKVPVVKINLEHNISLPFSV